MLTAVKTTIRKRLSPPLARFRKDQDGTVAVVLSVVLIPVIAAFGLATNYSDANARRSQYQAIADSAALAGATASASDSDEARKNRAKAFFDTQIELQKLPKPTVAIDVNAGAVTITATANVKPLISMAYLDDLQVKVASTAQIATQTIRRVLDVAFCIDATGSMQNTINSVKARANSFSDDLNNALAARGLDRFDFVRIRAVFYRDFAVDDDKNHYYWGYGWYRAPKPMVTSDFYEMPDKKTNLTAFLGTENASGGGDLPESGYECIHEGINSKWWKKNDKIPGTDNKPDAIYPVVILWSDADALPFNHGPSVAAEKYPPGMPRSASGFVAKWNNSGLIDQENKMLVHFGLCNNSSWSTARTLVGYMCGGTLSEGNTNMVNKIADAMQTRYKNLTTRLTK